ncbi:MAG: hypothetical protein V2I50_10420 [Desulfuromusa sp.]|nr:hypothetical protein [Desulfuromusa sp.]
MIDNLVGLYRGNGAGLQVYIHADLIEKFVEWLNKTNSEKDGDCHYLSWKAVSMDAAASLDVKELDNFFPLLADRKKIGYAEDLQQQILYQSLLKQAFPPRSLRDWRI